MKTGIFVAAACAAAAWVNCGAHAATTVIDFDDLSAGTPVTEIEGVTFSSSVAEFGLGLIVSDIYETTSGTNYLGVADGAGESFLGGDSLTLDFAAPVESVSVSVIAVPGLGAETFALSGGGETVTSAMPDDVLSFGDEVYVLSLAPAGGLTSVVLSSAFGLAAFGVDDITFQAADIGDAVPLPGAALFFATGLVAAASRRRR